MAEDKPRPEHNWTALFRQYTWWNISGRVFVIIKVWHDDAGQPEMFDLLEQNTEATTGKTLRALQVSFKEGKMQRTSIMPR